MGVVFMMTVGELYRRRRLARRKQLEMLRANQAIRARRALAESPVA